MRKVIVLVGIVVGVSGSWFVPAHAKYHDMLVDVDARVRVNGKTTVLSDGPIASHSCNNAIRQPGCDLIEKQTPFTAELGNATNGASVTISTGEGTLSS